MERVEVGEEVSERVRELSRRETVTVFMTMLAGFNVLLYRYTGQLDILIGTNIANRTRYETDGLIGFFLNQLVLRTDLSGNPTFRELLARVRKVSLEAYAHQNLPFDKLVEILNPERSLDRAPLFQVKIDFNDVQLPAMDGSGIRISPIDIEINSTHLDLILSLTGTPQGIVGTMLYSTDLFDAQTIVWMLEKFKFLLQEVVLRPEARLDELTRMLAEADADRQTKAMADFRQSRLQKHDSLKRRAARQLPVENYS
jgi:non-ribosomal peptide synthetase component F